MTMPHDNFVAILSEKCCKQMNAKKKKTLETPQMEQLLSISGSSNNEGTKTKTSAKIIP